MSSEEIHDDFIKTLGDESPYTSTMKKCAAGLGEGVGWESMEYYVRSGRPKDASTEENFELVHSLIMCDRRRRLRDIARQTGIRTVTVQSLLTDRNIEGLN